MSAPVSRPPIAPGRLRALRVMAALVGVLVVVGGAEVALRLQPPPRLSLPPHYDPAPPQVEWVELEGGGRAPTYQPGQHTFQCYDRTVVPPRAWDRESAAPDGTPVGCVLYRTSERGFRDADEAPPAAPGGRAAVAIVGDSFTFGEGVRESERATEQLAVALEQRAPGRFAVWNRGIQGLNLELALALYRARIRAERPAVLVYAFVPNDAQPFGETLHDETFLRAVPWRMPDEGGGGWCRLCDLVKRRIGATRVSAQTIAHVRESFVGPSGERFDAVLAALARETAADGVRLVVLEFPMTPGMSGDPTRYPFGFVRDHLAGLVSRLGVPLVDLYPDVATWPRERLWVHPTDPHPSTGLHALAANKLVEPVLAASPSAPR